ncbi:hypothetical protein EJB05_44818 [Eragrostis curvula]|uniref:Uncharacterized protein n=1 Tax=Eragrostis curvula TaxID=38414 RepID=A0A5J9TIX9_9POAL|nr:hypothetical protein EJB05_44818 [Eragrostis curvula]
MRQRRARSEEAVVRAASSTAWWSRAAQAERLDDGLSFKMVAGHELVSGGGAHGESPQWPPTYGTDVAAREGGHAGVERLERLLLDVGAKVEEAEGRHITNLSLLAQLKAVTNAMHRGRFALELADSRWSAIGGSARPRW